MGLENLIAKFALGNFRSACSHACDTAWLFKKILAFQRYCFVIL